MFSYGWCNITKHWITIRIAYNVVVVNMFFMVPRINKIKVNCTNLNSTLVTKLVQFTTILMLIYVMNITLSYISSLRQS